MVISFIIPEREVFSHVYGHFMNYLLVSFTYYFKAFVVI